MEDRAAADGGSLGRGVAVPVHARDRRSRLVRQILPDQPPFRAWSNFEFRDGRGRWHEVDLLVLGRRRLHLVELKYYAGRLRGDDHTWLRDGKRAEDSPLKLARRKAQYFASKLQDEFRTWVREKRVNNAPDVRSVVPFVQESVFLHHEHFRSELSAASAIGLYGLDGRTAQTNLPGLSDLLLEPADPRQKIHEAILVELMKRIGLVQRRQREAGSWIIENEPIAEGEGWQDWEGFHRVSQTDRGRIRFQIPAPGSGEEERQRLRTIAAHEYRVVGRLTHDGVLRPRDLVESELGIGLVYPHEEGWQRLDLWRAEQSGPVPLETAAVHRPAGWRGVAVRARQPGRAPRPRPHGDLVAVAPGGAQGPGPGLAERRRGGGPADDERRRGRSHLTASGRRPSRSRRLAHRGVRRARGRAGHWGRPGPGRRLRPGRPGLLPPGRAAGGPVHRRTAYSAARAVRAGSGPGGAAGLRSRCGRPCSGRPAPR